MSAFEQREQGFEARDAHERDMKFRAIARRDKRLGLWVAELLGMGGVGAEDYANAFAMSRVGKDDDDDLALTLSRRLADAKVEMSDHRIRRAIARAIEDAVKELSR